MTVREIIVNAFKLLGREDLAAAVSKGERLDEEGEEKAQTLLYCFNAVEDELARYYFPLKTTEQFTSSTGIYEFEKFAERPVKILSVKSGGNAVSYEVMPKYFKCDQTSVTVEYEYAPLKKELSDTSAFDGTAVCENLIAAGTVSEYYLISGAVISAQSWESRYREEIDKARKKQHIRTSIPPRRWV